MSLNKVDMSLDDIIKINKAEKRQNAKLQAQRGAKTRRGNGLQSRGTTRGTGRGRGRGRGGAVAVNTLRGAMRGGTVRGRGGRGSGGLGASTRGRGAGQQRQNPGNQGLLVRGRGGNSRARGQRQPGRGSGAVGQPNQGQMQLFTKNGLSKQAAAQQNQRLNKARKQAALLREKQLALKNLQQAQKNMQTVNLAIQKTNREAVVNQMRGLNNATGLPTATTSGRGRRKLLSNLRRPGNNASNLNLNNNSFKPNRQLNYTSVTISNPAALNPTQSQRGRRRPWNKPGPKAAAPPPASEPFKIEVTNQSPVPVPKPQQSSVLEKLKSLKPAVPTTYKFQKNVFAAPTTGVSLSERFAATSSSSSSSSNGNQLEDRKVFV